MGHPMSDLVDDYLGNEHTTGKLSINGTATGKLQRPFDEDWFAVTLEAGVTYYLNATSFSPADTDEFGLAFFDPRLNRLVAATAGSGDKEFALEFTPATSGIYYAVAANLTDNYVVSPYSLQIAPRSQPDDLPGNAHTNGVLTAAAPGRGVFEQLGDVDWFKFHAEKGYHYTFTNENRDQYVPGMGLMSSIDIVDANGRIVATPGLGFNPLETGDYYVAVTGSRAGTYGIIAKQWKDDFPEYQGTAGHLASDSTVQGSIDYELDRDWLRVDFEKGKFYTFTLRSEQDFVFGLTLYDEAGNRLDYVSSFIRGDGLQLTYQATQTGPVYLEIDRGLTTRQLDDATPYAVSLSVAQDDIGQDAAGAAMLATGAMAHGALQMRTDRDAFKVSLDAGVTYRFGLAADGGGDNLKLEVASATAGTALASKIVGSNGALEFTPSSAGEYLVTVGADGWVKPDIPYALTAERASDDWGANVAGAGQLAVGSSAAGKLDNAADRDWYAIRLEAGSTYWIEAKSEDSGAALGAAVRILDAAGRALLSYVVPIISAPLSFKPDAGGTYYVEISSPGQRTGTYTISAAVGIPDDVGDSIPTAVTLAAGATFNGQLETGSDKDVFRLDVVAGQTYKVNLDAPTFSLLGATLTDASGKALAGMISTTENNSQLFAFQAETTGAVYATVQGSKAVAYQIRSTAFLDDNPDRISATAKSLAEGGSINGNLEYGADRDIFGMQLDANRTYVLKIKSTTPGGAAPALEFLRDGPGYVSTADQTVVNGERTVKIVAQSAGQYFLELKSANQQGTSYTLSALPFAGDGKGPALIAQSHADHAVDVSLTERTISLKFSEPIVIDHSAIVLRNSAGEAVSTDFAHGVYYPLVSGDTLTIKVSTYFTPGTYTLSIPAAAIHDAAGNRYSGPESLTFTTVLPADKPGDGNDLYLMQPGAVIDGGPGMDTLSVGTFEMFDFVSRVGNDYVVSNFLDGTAVRIRNIERLMFLDQVVALDVDGIAGQAYRLYQAAFNRVPDQGGLGFWIGKMDHGVSLFDAANAFVGSAEFTALYGGALSDTAFAQTLYQNVLHRAPDAGGLDFWVHALQSGYSRPELLVWFSESAENQSALADIIGSGITYQSIWAGG
jgi:hypothetical protein